ncbi:hypothetical protein DFH09DRAFT_1109978 [Mycena vulgaris]|nr:hypothetical protein DFH09DRAFT_1109978 [Mycena vulgaris]
MSTADRNTWLLDKNFDEWKRLTSGSARFEAEEQGMYDKWYWDLAPGAGITGGGRGGMATHKINVNPIERAGRIAERGETGGPAMTSPDEARAPHAGLHDALKPNLAGTEPPPCTCPHGARACEKTDSGCLLHVVPAFYRVPDGVPRLVAPYMESFHWVGESEPDAATRVMRADERAILGGQLTQESRYSECSLLSLRAPVREGMACSGLLPPGMLPYGSPEAGVERRQVRKTVKESAAEAEARFLNYANV